MASLSVFCSPVELEELVRVVCRQYNLSALCFRAGCSRGVPFVFPDECSLLGDEYKVYLVPGQIHSSAIERPGNVLQREWGWIGVFPGRLVSEGRKRILLITQFGADDVESAQIRPSKYINWLKRKLRQEAIAGVEMQDVGTLVRDIWHTAGARDLIESGVIWKQFADGNVAFSPIGLNK